MKVKEYNMELWDEFKDDIGYGCEDCATIYLTYDEALSCQCLRFTNQKETAEVKDDK